jgi:chromosome segregation ATPase
MLPRVLEVSKMSEDGSDKVQAKFLVERHVKEAAKDKTQHGELSELCRDLFRRVAFGEEVAEHQQVEQEIQRERERIDGIDQEIRELQTEREKHRTRLSRLEERLSQTQSANDRFDAKLEEIEIEKIYQGVPAVPDLPCIQRAANEVGERPEHVINELRERNPHLPEAAFREQFSNGVRWCGLDDNDDPVTEKEGYR